jgi:hypothetical protein
MPRSGGTALAALLVAAAAARADVIVLVDGTRVEARLLEIDATNVRFVKKKGAPEEIKPRAEVAAVLFYEQAKGAPPAGAATDRVEMDDLAFEGTLVRMTREKLGYFGLTRLAVLEAGTGALKTSITTRRVGIVRLGKPQAQPQPKAKGPVAKAPPPLKPADAVSAAFKTLKPTDDVPAVVFGAEAVATTLTDEFAKKRIASQVDAAKKLLPQHEALHVALARIEVETEAPPAPSEDLGRPAKHDAGSGVYVYAHVESTTGELLGPVVRFAWRTKNGKTGCTSEQYFTKASSAEHVCHLGVSVRDEVIDRVVVELLDGARIVGEREMTLDGGRWTAVPAAAAGAPWWRNLDDEWADGLVRSQRGPAETAGGLPAGLIVKGDHDAPATTWHWRFVHGKPDDRDYDDDDASPSAPPPPDGK